MKRREKKLIFYRNFLPDLLGWGEFGGFWTLSGKSMICCLKSPPPKFRPQIWSIPVRRSHYTLNLRLSFWWRAFKTPNPQFLLRVWNLLNLVHPPTDYVPIIQKILKIHKSLWFRFTNLWIFYSFFEKKR
jgi:hypothetical protein